VTDAARPMRADAVRNRQRILDVARDVVASSGTATSMAEIARRSGIGQATLYRNFATRHALLEALLMDEVTEVCDAAVIVVGATPMARLTAWLRRFYAYVTAKRPVVMSLLEHTDTSDPVFKTRSQLLAAGIPLFTAAQDADELAGGLSLDQILDLVMAIAKIPGDQAHREPILDAALNGLARADQI
jgi:AcrR family transcriptional regulator